MNVDIIDLGLGLALAIVMVHNFRLSAKLDRLTQAMRETLPAIEAFSSAVDRSEQSVARLGEASRGLQAEDKPKPQSPARRQPTSLIQKFYDLANQKEKA